MCSDSKFLKKVSCGRTKAEAIVTDVLAPKALEDVVSQIKELNCFFSLQIDASNKKNIKLFPISAQFFSLENGLQNVLLDFCENAQEASEDMYNLVIQTLGNLNLSMEKVSCLSADNTNSNFGCRNSLYTKLKQVNSDLIKANCHAHIIHNCVKHALDELDNINVDVETIIFKIHSHFACSAKRRDNLKTFFDFLDIQWREILRHVETRWLSLLPVVHRLLECWNPLMSYLNSNEETTKSIKKIFHLSEDQDFSYRVELALLFLDNSLEIFQKTIKQLEGNHVTCVEIYDILTELKDSLELRMYEKFFGYFVGVKLSQLEQGERQKFENCFLSFYRCALLYLEKWFDFSTDNWLYSVRVLNISIDKYTNLNHNDIFHIIEKLKLKEKLNINMDQLFIEIASLKKILAVEVNRNLKSVSESWCHLLKPNVYPNMLKLISFLFSIPASSAFVERVFSIMNIKWRDDRNRCSVNLIKSELLIYFNLKYNCGDFYKMVKKHKKILEAAKSEKKYLWKR